MIISLASKRALVEKFYAIHADQCARYELACSRQCAACCTRNVTLTTLEGLMLLDRLQAENPDRWQAPMVEAAASPHFEPQMTLNAFADCCARDLDIPEEVLEPHTDPCPLLTEAPAADLCSIYPVRPFGCRAMVSRSTCTTGEAAHMPEFILTLNHILLQYLEGLDVPGFSGNLIDVLLFLNNPQNRKDYEQQAVAAPPETLLKNRPVSVLMIPPEHRQNLQPVLQTIQSEIKRAVLQSGLNV